MESQAIPAALRLAEIVSHRIHRITQKSHYSDFLTDAINSQNMESQAIPAALRLAEIVPAELAELHRIL